VARDIGFMPRKLKVYQTSLGFYDLTIAAPSMKAALEAWGANNNLFHQGFAKEANDDKVIEAAMATPGIVLRRPVGSNVAFRIHADLPSTASLETPARRGKGRLVKARSAEVRNVDEKADRRAAAAFEKARQRRVRRRQEEEVAAAKARAQRKAAIEKAEAELEVAAREHNKNVAALEQDLAAIQGRADAEQKRWEKLQKRLERALHNAGR
jgi:colicin import membrane protein